KQQNTETCACDQTVVSRGQTWEFANNHIRSNGHSRLSSPVATALPKLIPAFLEM
ncbi:hypothetical protein LEMLEM_LOCUS15749, partial [Lemmus lemmus]